MKCYHNHPVLELDYKGKTVRIAGGNGFSPAVQMDVYIDLNPRKGINPQVEYPTKQGETYYNFPIINMGVPNLDRLEEALAFAMSHINEGHSIHVGCIGGHGRTGLFLSALLFRMYGDENATQTLRDMYCPHAVESQAQVDYLEHNYGITPVAPRYGKPNWVTDL